MNLWAFVDLAPNSGRKLIIFRPNCAFTVTNQRQWA